MDFGHDRFVTQGDVKLGFILDGLFEINDFLNTDEQPECDGQRSGCTQNSSFQQLGIELSQTNAKSVALNRIIHRLVEHLHRFDFAAQFQYRNFYRLTME